MAVCQKSSKRHLSQASTNEQSAPDAVTLLNAIVLNKGVNLQATYSDATLLDAESEKESITRPSHIPAQRLLSDLQTDR
jgi:hypothetical protein